MALMYKQVPYACCVDERTYWNFITEYKADIIPYLPVDYLCIEHEHTDTYVHFAARVKLEKIIQQGYLTNEFSNEDNTIGKAVYTYPLKSGMYFYQDHIKDGAFLIFDATAPHCHIVQTNDTAYGIGEADFVTDKLEIQNPFIVNLEELKQLSREAFNWKYARRNYYGLNTDRNASYEGMYGIIDKYKRRRMK
jgi:hypothetical protein